MEKQPHKAETWFSTTASRYFCNCSKPSQEKRLEKNKHNPDVFATSSHSKSLKASVYYAQLPSFCVRRWLHCVSLHLLQCLWCFGSSNWLLGSKIVPQREASIKGSCARVAYQIRPGPSPRSRAVMVRLTAQTFGSSLRKYVERDSRLTIVGANGIWIG